MNTNPLTLSGNHQPYIEGVTMFTKVQEYAKFIAALIGTAVTAGTTLIPNEGLEYLAFIGALVTAVAVYAIPNKPAE
jgi:hypothetical protein